MSIMYWNVSVEIQRELEKVAKDEALLSEEGHEYLPKTPEDAAKFNPHEWILEAMTRAYVMGRTDGASQARAAIRSALGISSKETP